jgi:hypothetical protein
MTLEVIVLKASSDSNASDIFVRLEPTPQALKRQRDRFESGNRCNAGYIVV